MGKKLVRIDVDIWSFGIRTTVKPVVRETTGTVYVENEKTVRDRETHQLKTVKTAGPFMRRELRMSSRRPGARRFYFLSEAEDPEHSEEYRKAAALALAEIYNELMAARLYLEELTGNIKG